MMKKHCLIFLAVSIFASSIVGAQNFPRLEVLKIEIVRILNDMKLSPKMSKDNTISFSYEGMTYSMEYREEEEDLYFGSITRYQEYSDKISVVEIRNFNEGYNYKTVKVQDNGDGFVIKSEFFFDDKETLKNMCPHLLKSMSRTMRSLTRSASNFTRDSLLVVSSLEPVAVFADSTDISITALATIEANYPGNYIVGLRIYRNNSLMSFDDINDDFSRLDTLNLEKKNPLVKLSTCIADSLSKNDRLRYELWHNENCIASEIIINKTIE